MKKLRLIIIVILALAVVIALVFFLVGYFRPQSAGLLIETDPASSVFLDGQEVGRTPVRTNQKPGEVVVRLVPESFDNPLVPYETKLNLVPGIETVVRYSFGVTSEDSSGEIISFEKVASDETSLAVVTQPDAASVLIDGRERALAPYKMANATAGEHTIVVSSDGYHEKRVTVKTVDGFKLTLTVQLAKDRNFNQEEVKAVEIPEETPKKEDKVEVEILATPVGFLRVREEPSTLSDEVGRVDPGKTYELVDEDSKTGWFKIKYVDDKEGWISNQYAKKVGVLSSTTSPTPTPTKQVSKTPTTSPKPTITTTE